MSTAFTPEQLAAIDISRRHEDACIVAGPGSGKTTVLVEYFQRLVVDAHVDPLRILAITFTEKAAGNMRKKLADALKQEPETRAKLERAWVSTVHAFCARLLRENAVFAGIDPEFEVLDERGSWRMQNDAMRAAVDGLFAERLEEMRALIRGLSTYEFEQAVLAAYDTMRGAGLSVEEMALIPMPAGVTVADVSQVLEELREQPVTGWSAAQRQHLDEAMEAMEEIVSSRSAFAALRAVGGFSAIKLNRLKRGNRAYDLVKESRELLKNLEYTLITEIYACERAMLIEVIRRFDAVYRERKRAAGALDFSDLEESTVRLLEGHYETRARLQRQFDHILMDEFQDTNGQQAKLIGLIRPPDRFYAVGDINQSIFGFRHAEPEGFAAYRDEIAQRERRLVELEANFRSRAEILSAVETVTHGLPGIVTRALVPGRAFADAPEYAVETIVTPSLELEAQWVARRVLDLTKAADLAPGFAFQEMALLLRNTEVIGAFTDAFDAAGIPYVVNRGRGFYESREVNDLVHLLRVIANPLDEVSFAVVLRSPLVGASDEDLLRWRMRGAASGAVAAFRARLVEWRSRREYVTFDRLLAAAMDEVGYPWTPNVDKFLTQVREAAPRMSLDEFVAELALVREENPREPDAPPEDSSDTVKIMTVHSAKGLEFPVVFVAALDKGVNKAAPIIGFSRHSGLGARWRNPAAGLDDYRQDKGDLAANALREEWRRRDEEESSRLLYVAMTRAEKHLVLSYSVAPDRKPINWAKVVAEKLAIAHGVSRNEVVACTAPDGEQWKLQVLVTESAPELWPREQAVADRTAAAIEWTPRPEVREQQDTNATVTALAKFATCPRQYYLGTYLGYEGGVRRRIEAEDVESDDTPGDELGRQVHALLAEIATPDADPEAIRLAGVFQRSDLGRRAARASRVERESEFLMAVDDLVVRGQIDLWFEEGGFEEGGELVVVDYKTDAVRGADLLERAGDYAVQLRLYAMAVEKIAGRPVDKAYLYFLRADRRVAVDLSPGLWGSPEQVVREFQEAQSRLEFPLREGERCRRCPFVEGLCPATLAKGGS